MNDKVKSLFFSQYLGQKVFLRISYPIDSPDNTPVELTGNKIHNIRNYGSYPYSYLLLRDISQLTDEEKIIIANRMQIYPEDVLGWINGDCGHDDYENLNTWLPCYDILKAFGILLPFTYLSETNQPITLTPAEIINLGWAKLQSNEQ